MSLLFGGNGNAMIIKQVYSSVKLKLSSPVNENQVCLFSTIREAIYHNMILYSISVISVSVVRLIYKIISVVGFHLQFNYI